MSIWSSTKELAGAWASATKRRLEVRGTPNTVTDSGGSIGSHSWGGQELDRDELREVTRIRESGGIVAQLFHTKSLIKFGTGAMFQAEDDGVQEWLEESFDGLDELILDLGEDAIWYPYGLGEVVETRAGGFSHVELVEPWTTLPVTNEHGDVVLWEQQTEGMREPQPFRPEAIGSITVNRASGRDTIGISEVLRSKEEIQQFKDNQRAINKAIEIAGFPHHVWTVGSEDKAPLSDNDLRRVRNLVDDMEGDTQFVVGPDVDHDKITPADFEFGDITERDLRMLTSAIGLPFELVGYGSDGLGSGHEADLKLDLLAIQNEADRRRFADQFVEQFVRPVLAEFSPYPRDVDVELHIEPFLDDKDDLANLIDQVGDYMRNDQVVDKLDLPPIEDDEIAEAYRTPAEVEDPEGGRRRNPLFGSDRQLEAGASDLETFEAHMLEQWDKVVAAEDTDRHLLGFRDSATPAFVKDRLRDAILGGAIFNDFETVPASELWNVREHMLEALQSDGWTIDGVADQLMQLEGVDDRGRAETIARTETAATVNSAREEGYQELGQDDDRFYWTGADPGDDRQTGACEWLIRQTNPNHGGEPVALEDLRSLVDEAPEHDHEMQDDLARPSSWVVHPQCRSTFVRHVE